MVADTLLARHARILDRMEALEALVEGPPPHSPDALSTLRWNFTRDLMLHFSHAEERLFGPTRDGGSARAAARAEAALTRIAQFLAQFRVHIQRWNGLPPAHAWPEYRAALTALGERLRDLLDAEATDIAALAGDRATLAPPDDIRRPGRDYAAEAWSIRDRIFGTDDRAIA